MDRKTLTMILAVVLIGGFFLPYFKMGPFTISGFDFIKAKGGDWDKYLMLVIPLAAVLLLVGALNNENYILGRGLLSWLPLLGLLYLIVRSIIEAKGQGIGEIFKILGLGYWISLAAALVLAFYNPKKS